MLPSTLIEGSYAYWLSGFCCPLRLLRGLRLLGRKEYSSRIHSDLDLRTSQLRDYLDYWDKKLLTEFLLSKNRPIKGIWRFSCRNKPRFMGQKFLLFMSQFSVFLSVFEFLLFFFGENSTRPIYKWQQDKFTSVFLITELVTSVNLFSWIRVILITWHPNFKTKQFKLCHL